MLPAYSDICGISEKEIDDYFKDSTTELAATNGLTYEETREKLKSWYDGYHFSLNSTGIYNPFSLLNTFANNIFSDYWFETGTPSFLVELLKNTDYDLNRLQKEPISVNVLNSMDAMRNNPIPVIYQSGYLTINDYNDDFQAYTLKYPNKEVERGFIKYLIPYYTSCDENNSIFHIMNFVKEIREGRPEEFMERLRTMYDAKDYRLVGDKEVDFQNTLTVIFMMLGFYVEVEKASSRGRADIVISTKDYVYIMELKLDGSAEDALQQIEDKDYAKPFAMDSRKLYKIGVNFSSATHGIEKYLIQ